ncbi:MAG: hypothetical protein IIW94_03930 [Clostridia bacterium]|nr:hypothetical protein [Clostridia bacterium]
MAIISNKAFADIHTHILPGMDDGATSPEESLRMLLEEQRQGITDVVLTPHFNLAGETVEDFLARRQAAFDILSKEIKECGTDINVNLHLGAEVRYDPNLIYSDVFSLCIGNTSYMLLELTGTYPFNFEQTINWLVSKGISPVLAHIERYDFLCSNKKLLDALLYSGAVFQCNASSLLGRYYAKRVKKLIKSGYVQLLASDAHNTKERPPKLEEGLKKVHKYSEKLAENSIKIMENKLI